MLHFERVGTVSAGTNVPFSLVMMIVMPVAVCGEGVVGGEKELAAQTNSKAEEDLPKHFSHSEEKSPSSPLSLPRQKL